MSSHELYSTGSNSHGQLGLGSVEDHSCYTRLRLPRKCRPLALALGANHSLLLADIADERVLLGTGSNSAGQLGEGNSEPRVQFEPIERARYLPLQPGLDFMRYEPLKIASSWETSFVVLRHVPDGEQSEMKRSDILVSFGSNDWGERGIAGGPHSAPSVVSFGHLFNGPYRIRRLEAGPRHVLALVEVVESDRDTRTLLVGWGASRHGQLGSPDLSAKLPKTTPRPEIVPLPEPFSARDIVDLACGKDHSVISLLPTPSSSRATVILLGSNKHGQLGCQSEARSNLVPFSAISKGDDTVAISVHSTWNTSFLSLPQIISASGSDSHGQLGRGTPHEQVSKTMAMAAPWYRVKLPSSESQRLVCGSEHVIALVEPEPSKQELYAWGWNEHGNLGLGDGDVQDRREPVRVFQVMQERLNEGARIVGIWGGMATSWILFAT
ncbi:RCC1 domain-containing protein [Sporobolomyces koalae]|uniref:RCC1 domain-containing protein n=1 Tax=Sporobolomyces koalae TaxID=500713 RepID=UPI00317D6367